MEQKVRTQEEEKELLATAKMLLFGVVALPAFYLLLKGLALIQFMLFGYVQ
jgi:hypothetical protein